MSMDGRTMFVGFLALGLAVPAAMLGLGYPDTVMKGLATPGKDENERKEVWNRSSQAKFGLYMYTMSDVVLAIVCGGAVKNNVDGMKSDIFSTKFALQATAVHQLMYVSSAIPAFGFKKEHASSIITAFVAGYLSMDA